MPLTDPTAWFDDPNVHIADEELLEQAAALEPTLLHGRSRVGAAIWTSLVSALAGGFGGVTFSDEVRSSWMVFVAYLVVGAAVLRGLKPLGTRLVGESFAWHAVMACFWSFLLAMVAVTGGRIETGWLRHAATAGGGLFVGLMYGSLTPGFVRREDAWMVAALPLGALSAWSAGSVQRGFDASANPAWSEAYVGVMAASVFMVPMAVLMAMLSSRANALAKMATLYLHNEHFTERAIEYLDQAIALSPRSADLYNLRGIAYSKHGDGERADADFRKVSELSPRAAEAHMNRGVDFMRQGDFDRAIGALTFATTVNPKLATAHSNLGTAYQKKGDLDAAVSSYDRAIRLRPKYPIAFSNRAYAYYLKGDHERAVADATRAIALDARLPVAHLNLGHALAAKGDSLAAARAFRQTLDLSPDREVEDEALEALEKLGIVDADADDEDR